MDHQQGPPTGLQANPQYHEDYIDLSEGVGSRMFDKPVNNMGVAYICGKSYSQAAQ